MDSLEKSQLYLDSLKDIQIMLESEINLKEFKAKLKEMIIGYEYEISECYSHCHEERIQ